MEKLHVFEQALTDKESLTPVREYAQESWLSPEDLEYIFKHSKLCFHGIPQTDEFMSKRSTRGGQRDLVDQRVLNSMNERARLLDLRPLINHDLGPRGVHDQMRNQEINRAVYLTPAKERVTIYKDVEVTSGLLFKKKTTERREDGFKFEPIPMSRFSEEDTQLTNEQAHILTYYIAGTPEAEFKDITTNRSGRMAYFSIVLAESDAKKLYAKVLENPHIVDQIFDGIDPDLMKDQRVAMPEGGKVFIKPLVDEPYEFDPQNTNKLTSIKEEYIKAY